MSDSHRVSAPSSRSAIRLAGAVAASVAVIDLGSKIGIAALLQGGELAFPGGAFLTVVHNDTFARGLELGAFTLPATIAVAIVVLALAIWIGSALTRIDRDAPLALGLIAGATVANTTDAMRTGRGVVDFLGFETAGGTAVVFNLADVAAYLGVVLLARTALLLCSRIAAERRAVRASVSLRVAPTRSFDRVLDRPLPLPLVVEGPVIRHADGAPRSEAEGELLEVPLDSGARTARGIAAPRPVVEGRVDRGH